MISFAREIQEKGSNTTMEFKSFDKSKLEDYAKEAKERWGGTEAYREYEEKMQNQGGKAFEGVAGEIMTIFSEFGQIMSEGSTPQSDEAQALVQKLRSFITDHMYNCTPQILAGLGQMYTAEPRFTKNIDGAGGAGCADFAGKAIAAYCCRIDK